MSKRNRPEEPPRTPARLALVAAIVLLGGAGLGFRALDGYLTHPGDSLPLPPGTLDRIPIRIDGWIGHDVPVDEAIRQATGSDDLVNREYTREGGGETVGLYVAYGVRSRDLMPHRPEVCYPGAGWNLDGTSDIELALPGHETLRCRALRFSQAGFTLRRIVVINYYLVDGQYCPDVSLLRSKAWRGSRGAEYTVQVQVTAAASVLSDIEAAETSAIAFARDSAVAIRSIVPAIGTSKPDAAGVVVNGRSGGSS